MENTVGILTNQSLLMFSVLAFTGMIFAKISEKINIPDVVLFLLSGIVIGPSVLNLISLDNFPAANHFIITFGSAFILYEGGREINLKVLRDVKISVALLSTLGVLISAAVTGVIAMWIFHIPLMYALLLGAVVASTDPATLVPVFKQVAIQPRLKQTIISESAFNDAMGAILVTSMITVIASGTFQPGASLMNLVVMIVGGIVVGAVLGILFSLSISDGKYGIFHQFAPIMSLLVVATSYILAEMFGGSGYMATFVAGLICGNKKLFRFWVPELDFVSQSNFRETIALLMRMAIFILLGTHIDFAALGKYWLPSTLFVLGLMLIARPLSVYICGKMDVTAKWNNREMAFMMWVRETGVIPAALSSMIVASKMPYSDVISSAVFMTILITLLVQASTAKGLARKLQLTETESVVRPALQKAV